jgi:3-isopropylmalate/(R)-2-methylmalate dehydratase small subunit
MPEPLSTLDGIAASLPAHNIDTDVIMPKRFLKTITREGLAAGAFADLRFTAQQVENSAFVLNREPWRRAVILVVGDNFGCGSSREHAVWGLSQLGIRVLIGTSFAGIFYDNCRRNGVAALTLPQHERDRLHALARQPDTARMRIDIAAQCITHAAGVTRFALPADIRADLLAGRDAIAATRLRMPRRSVHLRPLIGARRAGVERIRIVLSKYPWKSAKMAWT